jgi:hypothetical protein
MHERPAAGEAVTPQTAVAEATESAAPRFAGVFAIVLPAGLLLQALVDHASYRHPVVPVVVWLGMLVAAAWLVPRARAGGLRAGHAVAGIAGTVTPIRTATNTALSPIKTGRSPVAIVITP